MLLISSGSIGAANIVGSFAGAQRTEAETDRNKTESAQRKFQADQKALSAHSLEDVPESDLSADRDPDGRRLDDPTDQHPPTDEQQEEQPSAEDQGHPAPDATGLRGNSLDLEA